MANHNRPQLRRWCAAAAFAVALTAAPLAGKSPVAGQNPVAGQSLIQRLLSDVADGRLQSIDFAEAALIASGVDDECELSGWLDLYLQKQDAALDACASEPEQQRPQSLHSALHRLVLRGSYHVAASDLRQTLAQGDFNCLSALAVYYDWCLAANVNVRIRLARGHVHLSLDRADSGGLLEPGARQWAVGRDTSGVQERCLTPVELLGKFYYNRGVRLLRQRHFEEGLAQLHIARRLDPDDADARANLVAGLNNWAVEYCRARRYEQAAPLIVQGLQIDPSFAPLVANDRLVRTRLGQP